jgi:hypothetical protein
MKIPRIIKHPNLGSLDDTGFIGVQRMSKKRRAVYEKLTNDFFRAYCEKQVTLGKPEVSDHPSRGRSIGLRDLLTF